ARLRKKHHLLAENHHGGDGPDVEIAGQLGLVFSIDLRERDIGVLFRGLFEDGSKRPTGTTPGRPEINYDCTVGRYRFGEVVFGKFNDAHSVVLGAYWLAPRGW